MASKQIETEEIHSILKDLGMNRKERRKYLKTIRKEAKLKR